MIFRIANMLYKKTRLEDTFGVNMLAVADGRPETMGLKKIIEHHVDFQFELATRKYKTLLAKELENDFATAMVRLYQFKRLSISCT